MRFKWHWGIGIAVVYMGFVLIRVVTIIIAEHNDVDLVTPNYYEKEINYEERITEIRNTKSLQEQVAVKTDNRMVTIQFPGSFNREKLRGDIVLFRPSDKRMDKILPIKPDSGTVQRIDLSALHPGYWKIQLSWEYEKKRYYEEIPLVLR